MHFTLHYAAPSPSPSKPKNPKTKTNYPAKEKQKNRKKPDKKCKLTIKIVRRDLAKAEKYFSSSLAHNYKPAAKKLQALQVAREIER